MGFDTKTGRPLTWPLRLGKVHWATLLPGLAAGRFTLRCRTIDEKGNSSTLAAPVSQVRSLCYRSGNDLRKDVSHPPACL